MNLRKFDFYVLAGYSLFMLLVTIRLLAKANDYLIGENYIGGLANWTLWWPAHALTHNYNLVYNNYTLFPVPTNLLPVLSLPTSTIYNLLRPMLGHFAAFNALLPIYLTLNGWTGYLFFKRSFPWQIAVASGLVLAINPVTIGLAARGEFHLMAIFIWLLWFLAWEWFQEKPTWRTIGIVAIVLYLVALMSLQFWNIILTLLIPYAAYVAYPKRHQYVDYSLFGMMVFSLFFLIFPAQALIWSTYTFDYKALHIWQGNFHISTWQILPFVGIVLGAFFISWKAMPSQIFWLAIVGINSLLYAKPTWSPLSVVFRLFDAPFAPDMTRPAIFGLAAITAGIVIIFQAIQVQKKQWQSLALALSIILTLGASRIWQDFPTSPVSRLNFYKALANDSEDYVVIDFPIRVNTLADIDELNDVLAGRSMAYGVWHQKKVAGGITSLVSNEDLNPYFFRPLLQVLTAQPLHQDNPTTAQLLRDEVAFWRVGYVLIHLGEAPSDLETVVRGWLSWTGTFCYVGTEVNIELWRARWHPAGCPPYEIQFSSQFDIAFGTGWFTAEGDVRWGGIDKNSMLTVWAIPASAYHLKIQAASPVIENQTVEIFANGERIGEIALSSEMHVYELVIPRLLIEDGGQINLELRHSQLENIEGRNLTALYEKISLEAVNE